MTKEQLHILQHSLGVDQYGQGNMRRNHFCAGKGDEQACRDLVAMGYMREHRTTELYPYYNCSVTDEGKAAMLAESPKPPKVTRSQARYTRFLNADSGMSFREWLQYEKDERRREKQA